jgi:hypothetical protein
VDRSTLAAKFIRAGLQHVVVIDKPNASDQSGNEDRPEQENDVNPDEEKAA